MFDFRHDCVNPTHSENAKLCYINTDSFIIRVKTDDVCKNIAEHGLTGFETSNYEVNRPLPTVEN